MLSKFRGFDRLALTEDYWQIVLNPDPSKMISVLEPYFILWQDSPN